MNKQIDSEKLIEWLKSIEAEFPSAGEYMTIQIKNIKDKILSLQSSSAECDVQAVMSDKPITKKDFEYAINSIGIGCKDNPLQAWLIDKERAIDKCFFLAQSYHIQNINEADKELPSQDDIKKECELRARGQRLYSIREREFKWMNKGANWIKQKSLPIIAKLKNENEILKASIIDKDKQIEEWRRKFFKALPDDDL